MAQLTIRTPIGGRPVVRRQHGKHHPKAKIVTDGGLKFVMPYAPREGQHTNIADVFTQLARPGRKPLLVRTGADLRVETFTLTIAHRDPQTSVEPYLKVLRQIAESGDRCSISLSRLEHGIVWRLTGLNINVTARQHGTNNATRATAELTFTEAVDGRVKLGPLTGGKKPPHHRHDGGGGNGGQGKGGKNTARRYTVRKGDTLTAIALKFYDDPNDWHRIAKANKIRDPRKLRVGQRLVIPPNE